MHPALTKLSTLCLLPILLISCTTITPSPTTQSTLPKKMTTEISQLRNHDAQAMAIMLHDLYGIAAVADPRTNILIIHGTPEQCEEALKLVSNLEKTIIEDPMIFIYPIKNMQAADLAVTLQSMIDKRFFNQPTALGPPSAAPAIVVYERYNALLVIAPDRSEAQLRDIIEKLDHQVPNPPKIPG